MQHYMRLLNDPAVDIVYVATPHSLHHKHTIMCLNHKKAVLCEKAFAINKKEAEEMIETARVNRTFLMEAFWTAFQPSFHKALEIVDSGELGSLKAIRSDFLFNAPFNEERRLYNISLGAGSLLDVGIYPVFAALTSFGKPDKLKTLATFSSTGSEESINIIFQYNDGKMATLSSGFNAHSSTQTEYWCENGYLVLNPRWFAPTNITVVKKGKEPLLIHLPVKEGFGYQHEARHVMECIDAGRIESDILPWKFSLDLMETLDRIRIDAGIFYPGHDKDIFSQGITNGLI